VARYASPEEFAAWAREGYGMGFKHVASGPLVRSSYRASEAFLSRALKAQGGVVEGARRRLPVVP
jgi:lipoic acid synthetase